MKLRDTRWPNSSSHNRGEVIICLKTGKNHPAPLPWGYIVKADYGMRPEGYTAGPKPKGKYFQQQ